MRSDAKALAIFFALYGILIALLALTLYVDNLWLRMLCAVSAGGSISVLFVIGHDAAHSCYSISKTLDAVLGRLALLPALHNFTLWRIVYNRMHHMELCVQGLNSWSPLSKERLYRSPLGLGQHQLSVQLVFPKWFGLISNNIMEHPAHHVNTKIPLYNLANAQSYLNEMIGPAAVIERFTPLSLLRIMQHCKLFDYENQQWLGFDGSPSVYADPAPDYGDSASPA